MPAPDAGTAGREGAAPGFDGELVLAGLQQTGDVPRAVVDGAVKGGGGWVEHRITDNLAVQQGPAAAERYRVQSRTGRSLADLEAEPEDRILRGGRVDAQGPDPRDLDSGTQCASLHGQW